MDLLTAHSAWGPTIITITTVWAVSLLVSAIALRARGLYLKQGAGTRDQRVRQTLDNAMDGAWQTLSKTGTIASLAPLAASIPPAAAEQYWQALILAALPALLWAWVWRTTLARIRESDHLALTSTDDEETRG